MKKGNIQSKRKFTRKDIIITVIALVFFICLIISCFLYYNSTNQYWLLTLGYITLIISLILGVMARFSFKKKGGALEGESCLQTKLLVNSGIYGIIRNPMYLSPMLFTIGLFFISQHWSSLISAILIISYFYYYMLIEEKLNIEKFGNDYLNYMKMTPRLL